MIAPVHGWIDFLEAQSVGSSSNAALASGPCGGGGAAKNGDDGRNDVVPPAAHPRTSLAHPAARPSQGDHHGADLDYV